MSFDYDWFTDDEPFDDCGDDCPHCDDSEDGYDEDEARDARGTSECDGLCIPQCSWCLVGHLCPDECEGGECPYDALQRGKEQ